MTGRDKFDEARKKIKGEVEEKEVQEEKAMAEVKSQLDAVRDNPDLAKMYQDSADIGSENLAGQMPYLKVHVTGKSSVNELPNGEQPNDGWFFYKPTQEQFESVECHILTVSGGYRVEPLEARADGKKQFNQIVAGTIIQDGKFLPFLMIFTGLKLSYLWEFGKEVRKYTKNKELKIPLFALRIKLTTEKIKTNNKLNPYSRIVRFEVMKNSEGFPIIVTDLRLFESLKAGVEKAQEKIEALISSKSVVEQEDPETIKPLGEDQVPVGRNDEPVTPDDIPF